MMTREEIITELFECMNIAKRGMHTRLRTIIGDLPVSPTQLELLLTIKHLQPVSFKKLAAQLQLTPGAISQVADGLNQQELITRETDASDRRIQTLKLSKKGDELLQAIDTRRHNITERVVQDLTTDELAVWLRIQRKMIAEFQQVLDTKESKKAQ
jgi:DNA-binding MarR family transcriptional regulator